MVDEAGMVDSQSLARLIDHAHTSQAKLVLIGDPAQLGEIEAGGLFAAIARRSEELRLDEVIRHSHELDREAARLIRDGQGVEAVERYAREGRVVVAVDHEARREAIVADWWQAKQRGEDALMIAKLNSERARLNELAREAMRADGRLGSEEIEVGGQRFASGEEVITRVNDRRAQIFNRERWRIEAVDVEHGRLRLAGIDTNRQVGVDSGYLERVNPADGAPAIEHGYAATIYQAQGATLDSAYVMADPSMDRQEFYVAASRTRGETFFYATPEVGFERIEIAPAESAEGLDHIARAAERDGAQAAAHDAALREELGQLSTPELYARSRELASEAGAEAGSERVAEQLERDLASALELRDRFARQPEELGAEPPVWARADRAAYRKEQAAIEERQGYADRKLAEAEAEIASAERVEFAARAERAVAEHLISERERARVAAVRLDPPDYLIRELGERPSDPAKRTAWDRAVAGVETYRQEHGIGDRDSTLGAEPRDSLARVQHRRATETLQRAQRQLRLEQTQARVKQQTRSIGIEG
ncbi:MAG TPA: AAA family ATPase [Solirubrobacterales bacterium]